jgi:hypothetical protein
MSYKIAADTLNGIAYAIDRNGDDDFPETLL